MNLEDSRASFATTRWTLVDRLREGTDAERAAAADSIARTYWPAVFAHLRHLGRKKDEAAEITQDFYETVVLGRKLVAGAKPGCGRLRTLIMSSLKNFLIDRHRREVARGGSRLIPLDEFEREEKMLGEVNGDADAEFDRRWARAQLFEALRRCEEHYRAKDKERNWKAYYRWVVRPSLNGDGRSPREHLALELGFANGADLSQAVQTVDKMMRTILREVVAETTVGGTEAEGEFDVISRLLG